MTLAEIKTAMYDWAVFSTRDRVSVVLSADLVAGDSVVMTVNSIALAPIVFSGSHANTMALIAAQLTALAVIDSVDVDGRYLQITGEPLETVVVNSLVVTPVAIP